MLTLFGMYAYLFTVTDVWGDMSRDEDCGIFRRVLAGRERGSGSPEVQDLKILRSVIF